MAVVRVSIRVPQLLRARMLKQVEADGYGDHGKSKWIREAFLVMLKHDPHVRMLGQGDSLEGVNEKRDLVTLPFDIKDRLDSVVLQLKIGALFPDAGISLVLRTAIRFRLERPKLFTAKPSSSRVVAAALHTARMKRKH